MTYHLEDVKPANSLLKRALLPATVEAHILNLLGPLSRQICDIPFTGELGL
jgi:hypothetical protein